ncbi:MAG: dockerin type I repeat-containing protein [Euryarchaeota archaeon]|nr:dockerin type I repeat-containing protein [Euryarchaeota archaeon]
MVVSSASQSDFDSMFANLEDAASGSVSILAYQTLNPGLDGDVIVANVTFITVGNSGSSTPLDLEVTTLTDATPDCNPIPYTIRNGSFTRFLNGDMNGDGIVDVADCMFLAKHLLGASGFETIVEDAADVNDNGEIEASDCMYLAKHLAEIAGFEVLK